MMQATTKANARCVSFAYTRFRKQKGKAAKSFQHLVYAAVFTIPASCAAEPSTTVAGNFRVNTPAQTRLRRENM